MTDDFDDMGMMRRKVLALEQTNGDLGETIGVLKQERARLWAVMNNLVYAINHMTTEQFAHGFDKPARDKAMEALKEIRIDK